MDDDNVDETLFIEHSSEDEGLTRGASSKTGTLMNPGGGVIDAVKDWTLFFSTHLMLSTTATAPEFDLNSLIVGLTGNSLALPDEGMTIGEEMSLLLLVFDPHVSKMGHRVACLTPFLEEEAAGLLEVLEEEESK